MRARDISISRGQLEQLTLYANTFKIPKYLVSPIIKKMVGIKDSSGMEYCCQYMKGMKLNFLKLKGGLPPPQQWISKSGPFKGLVTWSRQDHKRWSRVICLLQAYTVFYSSKITPSQEKKFLDGVQAEPTEYSDEITRNVVKAGRMLFSKEWLPLPRPHILNLPNPSKRAPHPNGKTYREDKIHLESVNYVNNTYFGLGIKTRYPDIWKATFEGIKYAKEGLRKPAFQSWIGRFVPSNQGDLKDYPDSVGKIGFIQEAGFKLRAVANPGRIYQSMLKPLGNNLFKKLRELPWDCTFNQTKGLAHIQAYRGMKYSIDLSGATDYFPLKLQISLLESLFYNNDQVNLFKEISQGPWIYKDSIIHWKRGQPLGLFPSFASFALTHGILLYSLNNFSHNNDFYVLGDDVIILSDDLYPKYIKTLQELGCPISEAKSICSDRISEFAGKIITKDTCSPQLKWRDVSDDNFLDLTKNIGLSFLNLLKPKQRRIATILADIPDFLNGLGFNPKGIPLKDRIAKAYSILKDGTGGSYLMDFNRVYHSIMYYDETIIPSHDQFTLDMCDFDKKSKELVNSLMPLMQLHFKVLGKNLFDIDDDLNHPIMGSENRRTTLSKYEYLLQ